MRTFAMLWLASLAAAGYASVTVGRAPGARTLVIPAAHLSLRYPVGWHAVRRPVSAANSSQELLTIGNFRVRPHGPRPAAGGLLILYDEGTRGAERFPPRQAHFAVTGRPQPGALACLDIPWAGYSLIFRDHGRAFQAFIGLGPRATAGTKKRLLGVLDSLKVNVA